jgi:broad specificity phosphatase PhoE
MKPNRVIFVRHGQSEGNVNKHILDEKPDYALELTPLGWRQAEERGKQLRQLLGKETVRWYISSCWRTRQTFIGLRKAFPLPYKVYEDPRLREQEWGNLRKGTDYNEMEEARDSYGHFYYRLRDGESCADVYDRFGAFLNTLYRDFEKPNSPKNVIIVTHGMTMRVAIARWLHYTVEEFEALANPENTGTYVLVLGKDGKYHLETEPRRYARSRHPHQFQWPPGGPTGLTQGL